VVGRRGVSAQSLEVSIQLRHGALALGLHVRVRGLDACVLSQVLEYARWRLTCRGRRRERMAQGVRALARRTWRSASRSPDPASLANRTKQSLTSRSSRRERTQRPRERAWCRPAPWQAGLNQVKRWFATLTD